MKKVFLSLMAAAMLFTTSCQQQELTPDLGGEVTVTFNVGTPEIATRAYSDGSTATKLQYAVYHSGTKTLASQAPVVMENNSATLSLQLTSGETYNIILWAESEDANFYTVNLAQNLSDASVTVSYTGALSNDENRDAFYACKEFTVNGAQTETVELRRPFAQLNIGTNDYEEAKDASDYEPTESSVTVTGIYNTLNLADGTVSATDDFNGVVTFGFADIDKTEAFPYDDKNYDYVAMNYVLVGKDKSLVDVEFTVAEDNNVNPKTRTVSSVPVQRNYRTNIYGSILTSDVDVNVEIKPGYDGTTNVSVWDGVTLLAPKFENNTYEIYEAAELAYIAQLVNETLDTDNVSTRAAVAANSLKGCTIKLMNDIDLAGEEWTPIGYDSNHHFQGTLDGNEHIIHGLKVAERRDARAALFGTVSGTVAFRNLTIKGASIVCPDFDGDFYGSALIGTAYGNVTIENVDVIDSYISGNNKVGALLAHDGVVSSLKITDCDVYNTTFEALNEEDGGSVGGLVGYFQGQANGEYLISNSTVKKCTFNVVNSTNTGKRANGQLMGGLDSKAGQELYITDCTIENNTWNETFYEDGRQVTENTFVSPYGAWIGGERDDDANGRVIIDGSHLVSTAKELQHICDIATGTTHITLTADISGNVTVIQKPGVKITIDGKQNKYQGFIKVHSNSNHYADAALTIKNVNFETSTVNYDSKNEPYFNFIEALENGSERYSTNITVEGCTFTATDDALNKAVALQIKASKNAKVIGCAATNMHSLIQAQSCDETVVVNGCTINGKNGVAFKQVKAATVEGTTITALEYGIRFDGNTDDYGITVKDNDVEAVQPLIVRKMTGKNNTITLEGTNKLTTEAEYQIVITNGSDDETYVKPTGTYTLTGVEGYSIFPAPYPVATWDEFTAALAAGETDIKLTADITFDANYQLQKSVILNLGGYSMTLPMINIHTNTTIKNGTINGKVYARKNSEIVFNKVTFSGAVADNLSTEGHLAIQGGCKSLYAKDCLFSPTSVSGSQTKPLSFEGGSTIMKFENCEFKSSPYKKQVYFNSLSATGSLDFTTCNFNNKTPNIMFAAACPLTNVKMSGTTKLNSVTFETNRAKDAVTDADLAYLRELIANNSFSSVRLFYAGGSSEYIR